MKNIFKIGIIGFLSSLSLHASSYTHIVGSSTVYPFASAVSEELSSRGKVKSPLLESTGSGGGFKLFCSSHKTPNITNASRRMKKKELLRCKKNNISSVTEILVGYDGIAIAQSKKTKTLSIKKEYLMLALAKLVPNKSGTKLIDNPYKKWNQINSNLPNKKIRIYGPPKSSGTRDALEDLVLKDITKHMSVYKEAGYKKYHVIRQDGVYIPSGENDNIIVKKLTKDRNALGIFGYSYLLENESILKGAIVDNVKISAKSILSGEYPISRSLYFYVNNKKRNKAVNAYVNLFLSDDMMGEDGYLLELGLIPMSKNQLEDQRKKYKYKTALKPSQLK